MSKDENISQYLADEKGHKENGLFGRLVAYINGKHTDTQKEGQSDDDFRRKVADENRKTRAFITRVGEKKPVVKYRRPPRIT